MSEVYYKIIIEEPGKLSVVCLQDFDEADYPRTNWFSDFKFENEVDAEQMITSIYAFIGKYRA